MQSIKTEVDDVDKGKITMDTGKGPTVEIETKPKIEVEEMLTITEVIGPIIELGVDQEIMGMEMFIEEITILKTIEETIERPW